MKHWKLIPTLALATLSLGALPAFAEPSRTVNWLMDQPMSLFDWGIYKTDKKASELKIASKIFTAEFFSASAEYDWDANKIRIRVLLHGVGTEAECIENLKIAKGSFLGFKWTDKEQILQAPLVFTGLFDHEGGYKVKTAPKDLGEQMAKIAMIETFILVKEANGNYAPKAKCQADFVTSSINTVRP
jgi:hypothetical protein